MSENYVTLLLYLANENLVDSDLAIFCIISNLFNLGDSILTHAVTYQWQEAEGSYKPARIKESVFQTLIASRLRCVH